MQCTDQKTVFEGIEFYIPQLAHMIIHLEVDWPTAALEQFVLIVCQHSLHFALQLHFILVGAMEDYQLEMSDGRRSVHGNPRYYRRCAKLLQVRACTYPTTRRPFSSEHARLMAHVWASHLSPRQNVHRCVVYGSPRVHQVGHGQHATVIC